MKKTIYSISLVVAVMALFMLSVPVQASPMDDRIESTARNSYVFKSFLQNDDIKIVSSDGNVILTGIVADNFSK